MEPLDQRRVEFFLAGAGSTDVNGNYVQTNSEVDVVFYEKRPSDSWYINGDTRKSSGKVFIITLDSLPDMGEDFELAWVLKSPDAVVFYAAPFEEDEEMPPLKGWVAIEGLQPAPSHIIERPVQPPRDRTSNLDIIVEDEERDFSLPYWEPDEYEVPGSVVETDTFDPFFGWDNNFGDDDSGDYSSEQDDSDEIELPTDLMDNFKDGIFGHRPRANSVERMSDQERRSSGHQVGEGKEDAGDNIFLDSDSSDDECIVRHDTAEFEFGSGRLDRISSVSSQGEALEQNEELTIESPRSPGALEESDMTSSTSQLNVEQANNNQEGKENQLSLEIKSRKSQELNERPLSPENRNGSPRSPHTPGMREGSRHGSRVLRSGGSHRELVINLPEDPFSTPTHSRYRRSRDYIDIDLVTAPPELLSALSPRRKSARRGSGRNMFDTEFPFQMRRRRSSERRSSGGRERSNSGGRQRSNSSGRERSNSHENLDEPAKKRVERKKSEEAVVPHDEIKQSEEKLPEQKEDTERLKLKRQEIQKLKKEAHQLKTKMRKCDRISKIRKRGTSLSKIQQEWLVNKSKYQHRYEEIKKLLGSDNIKS